MLSESLSIFSIRAEALGQMSDAVRQFITEHRVYYEVSPYYVVVEPGSGSPAVSSHRIHAGFDIDVYGARTDKELPARSRNYELGYADLQKIAEETPLHNSESCSIEVTPFLSTIFLDTQDHLRSQAMLRIRIWHWRGLDQPAGPAEERALAEVEKRLQDLGMRSGKPAELSAR